MQNFFYELSKNIKEAVKQEFPKIKKRVGKEKIYAVAFVTDSDCITLWLGVNTNEYLKKKDAEIDVEIGDKESFIKEFGDSMSLDEIEKFRNAPPETTKWYPDEWGYSDGKNSALNKISELLYKKQESLNSEEESTYKAMFFETITSAFQELIKSGVFQDDVGDKTYFITMTDDDRAIEIENSSAESLNSKKNYENFIKEAGHNSNHQ